MLTCGLGRDRGQSGVPKQACAACASGQAPLVRTANNTVRRLLRYALVASMSEIIFVVEEAAEGGYTARALGTSIFTEADTLPQLHDEIRDAVRCHFDEGQAPKVVRLHFVREELLAV